MNGSNITVTTGTSTGYVDWPSITTTSTGCCGGKLTYSDSSAENKMVTIKPLMERVLDADTRLLIKAGYLTKELELTQEGKDAIWAILFVAKKKELVELAEEKLDLTF